MAEEIKRKYQRALGRELGTVFNRPLQHWCSERVRVDQIHESFGDIATLNLQNAIT